MDLYFKDKKLNPSSTIFQSGLRDKDTIISKSESYKFDEACVIQKEKAAIKKEEGKGIIYGNILKIIIPIKKKRARKWRKTNKYQIFKATE